MVDARRLDSLLAKDGLRPDGLRRKWHKNKSSSALRRHSCCTQLAGKTKEKRVRYQNSALQIQLEVASGFIKILNWNGVLTLYGYTRLQAQRLSDICSIFANHILGRSQVFAEFQCPAGNHRYER